MEEREDDLFVALEEREAVLTGRENDSKGGDDGNILADLMPGCYGKIAGENETIDTVDFAEIRHILSNRGAMDFLEGPKLNTIIGKGDGQSGVPVVDNSSLSTWYNHQNKENIPLDPNTLPRRGFTRREGSGRTTTRRSFKLDLRDIQQPLLDSSQSYYIPKDVNAFWEAEDEREASETILQKLQGKAQTKEVSNRLLSTNQKRHVLVRRKGSGRRTSRKFDIELPPYVEKLGFAVEEQLNEEGEKGPSVCSTGGIIACPGTSKDGTSPMPTSDTLNSAERLNDGDVMEKGQTIAHDCTLEAFCVEPPTRKASDCLHIRQNPSGCNQLLSVANNSDDAGKLGNDLDCEIFISVDRWPILSTDCEDFANTEKEMSKLTPYHKDIINLSNKSTPATSPTPPANPLEALGLKKERFGQDGDMWRLDFGNVVSKSNLNSDSASDGLHSELATKESMPCDEHNENKLDNSQNHSKISKPFKGEKCAQKSRKSKTSKKLRNSLEGAGTSVDGGVRRSLRIRSRPLEYWRGERFLFGRVHESLVTVIGIKHSSPPVCWPKRGYKGPNFKVESFVPDEHADYVQFAAL